MGDVIQRRGYHLFYIYIYIMASKLRRECILENVSLDHMKFTLFFQSKRLNIGSPILFNINIWGLLSVMSHN